MEFEQLCELIRDTLKISNVSLDRDTRLLSDLPEFDSLSLLILLKSLEEKYNISIEKAELSSDIFATIGSLWQFVKNKTKLDLGISLLYYPLNRNSKYRR